MEYKLAKEILCVTAYFLHSAKLLMLFSHVVGLIIASGSFLRSCLSKKIFYIRYVFFFILGLAFAANYC